MSTDKQIAANRANAAKSSGPQTACGKARSRHNALRHGLSIPIRRDSQFAAQIEELARVLVSEHAPDTALKLASVAAEAHFDLTRAHRCRDRILNADLIDQLLVDARAVKTLTSLDRYEQRAIGRRRKALRALEQIRRLPLFG